MKGEARAIEDLELDDRCQVRIDTDHDAIEAYRDAYADDVELPPVEVVDVEGVLYVIDGFHRVAAAKKAGLAFLRVVVVELTDDFERAQWLALSRNQAHGIRLTSEDKRRAVRMALDNGIGVEQSSRVLAEHLGVSHPFVSKVRQEWEAERAPLETVSNAPATVTTKDGRQYPKHRSDNGHPPPKPPKPKPTPFVAFVKNVEHVVRAVPDFFEAGSEVHELARRLVALVHEHEAGEA